MRALLVAMLLVSCAGPSQKELAETPTGQSQRDPSLAPPASEDDKDRYRLNEGFEDQRAADQAYREANGEAAGTGSGSGSGSATPPPKQK